jgi:hypothetical protein
MQNNVKKIIFLTLFLFVFLVKVSDAANLSVEVSQSSVKIGDLVTATVYVDSSNEAINNVEGTLSISSNGLEIQSISTSGSILNLWVEQPTFSQGSVLFNGGATNPGYVGSRGKVLTIFMKAAQNGNATISFSTASVRANDGLGTDVLNNKTGAIISMASPVFTPEPVLTPSIPQVSPSLKAPIVYSSNTPDSEKWYNINDTVFSWDIPQNGIALRTLLGAHPDSEPTVLYDSIIESKTVENIGDGVWYFHLKYQTTEGWSKTAHKKIKIDTTPPAKTIAQYRINESGFVELSLIGDDALSGISKYVLSSDDKEKIEITNVNKNGETNFVFPPDYVGNKKINIETYDAAGNTSNTFVSIDFPTFEIPKISISPSVVKMGENILIEGTSKYPNTQVKLSIQIGQGKIKDYIAETKADGSFSFDIKNINEAGILSASVKMFFTESTNGIESEKISVVVEGMGYVEIAQRLTNILSVFVPVIALILLLIMLGYIFYKYFVLGNKDRERSKKINKIEKEAVALIESLRSNILEDIHLFKIDRDIQDINEAETVLLKNLLQDFKNIEKVISTRLKRNKVVKEDVDEEGRT